MVDYAQSIELGAQGKMEEDGRQTTAVN